MVKLRLSVLLMNNVTLPRTPSSRLDGKRALVTGASSGIGLGAVANDSRCDDGRRLVSRTGGGRYR
jgi:hypothetical protein